MSTTDRTTRTAFSLVELLVVIAIIGLLVSIISVALQSSLRAGRKTTELSNVRQVGNALLMYAGSHDDRFVRGWQSTGVQELADDTIVFPDFVEIPPAPTYRASDENIAGPWTWHLVPYIDDPDPILRWHLDADEQRLDHYIDQGYEFAHEPAFAYNGWYLGGQWDFWDPHYSTPQLRFASVEQADGAKVSPVVRTIPHVKRSTEVVAFCSAFEADGPMDAPRSDDVVAGTWLVEPRLLANELKWGLDEQGGVHIHDEAHVPLGRNGGLPVTWFVDGHTDTQSYEDLADQRRWIDRAKAVGDTLARDWSHEDDVR